MSAIMSTYERVSLVDLHGGIMLMSMRVFEWGSILVWMGCLTTTSPGRIWGARSKRYGCSNRVSCGVVCEINGKTCW